MKKRTLGREGGAADYSPGFSGSAGAFSVGGKRSISNQATSCQAPSFHPMRR